jgi:hypothetical protein
MGFGKGERRAFTGATFRDGAAALLTAHRSVLDRMIVEARKNVYLRGDTRAWVERQVQITEESEAAESHLHFGGEHIAFFVLISAICMMVSLQRIAAHHNQPVRHRFPYEHVYHAQIEAI